MTNLQQATTGVGRIVYALAYTDPICEEGGFEARCTLCHVTGSDPGMLRSDVHSHTEGCPWRLAYEYIQPTLVDLAGNT